MLTPAYFAWRFRCLKWLRASLIGGAALSLILAYSLALRPQSTTRLLGIGSPENPFYLWLPAVLLAAVGIVYLLASLDVRRFSSIIAVGIGAQLTLALALFAAAQGPGTENLIRLAGAELLIGLGLLAFWWPVRS
jgi:hypothetical protein